METLLAQSGIYKIQSIIKPDRIYIGSTNNYVSRKREHLKRLRGNYHHSTKLQRHYNKYGEGDLEFTLLVECDIENLVVFEQYFIDQYKPYFNNNTLATNNTGIHWPQEVRDKISQSLMGNIPWNKGKSGCFSEESIQKMRDAHKGAVAWNKGIPCREETKEKLRDSKLGKPLSDEWRANISESISGEKHPFYGKKHSEESKAKMRKKHKKPNLSEEQRKKMSERMKGNTYNKKKSS